MVRCCISGGCCRSTPTLSHSAGAPSPSRPLRAGKSTLALWFAGRGHQGCCDDVCAVGFDAAGARLRCRVPRLRLWKDARGALRPRDRGYELSFDGQDKYDVRSPPRARTGRCPSRAATFSPAPGRRRRGPRHRPSARAGRGRSAHRQYLSRRIRAQARHCRAHLRQCLAIRARGPVTAPPAAGGRMRSTQKRNCSRAMCPDSFSSGIQQLSNTPDAFGVSNELLIEKRIKARAFLFVSLLYDSLQNSQQGGAGF